MKVTDFDYELPEELIAQTPMEKRDESRLMVLDRKEQTIEHKHFKDVIDYLEPGDVLVRNNTKVIPARLYGKRHMGMYSKTWKQITCRNKSNIWRWNIKGRSFRHDARRN